MEDGVMYWRIEKRFMFFFWDYDFTVCATEEEAKRVVAHLNRKPIT